MSSNLREVKIKRSTGVMESRCSLELKAKILFED